MQLAENTVTKATEYMGALAQLADRLYQYKFTTNEFDHLCTQLIPEIDGYGRKVYKREDKINGLKTAYRQVDVEPYQGTAYGAVLAVTDYASHNIFAKELKPTQLESHFKNTVCSPAPLLSSVLTHFGI
jgi:hypothetical protein